MTSTYSQRLLSYCHPSWGPCHRNGSNTSCMICGTLWTTKSCLRALIFIVLINVIVVAFYLMPVISMKIPHILHGSTISHPAKSHFLADVSSNKLPDGSKNKNIILSAQRAQIEHLLSNQLDKYRKLNVEQNHNINLDTSFSSTRDGFNEEDPAPSREDPASAKMQDRIRVMNAIFSYEYGRDARQLGQGATLRDEDHPQYSLAFPRHIKPLVLVNWTRSDESRRYFHPIDDQEAWVYSSFHDDRNEDVIVRVFGITLRKLTGVVFCHYLGPRGDFLATHKGRMALMKDSHGAIYSPMEIICPIKAETRPIFVRVTFAKDAPMPTNQLKVHYPGIRRRNFTVCFPPFHSNYSQAKQLVQTIELNRVFGANHFVAYNFSMTDDVGRILQQYQSEGILTIMQWPLPCLGSWYYGQVLAINDCVYRNMGTSEFVVVSDTDELIVPHIHSSWMKLLETVQQHPWMRNDEFKDPDIHPISGDRPSALLSEEDMIKGRVGKRKDGRGKAERVLHRRSATRHAKQSRDIRRKSMKYRFVDGDRFTRNSDTFPSRSRNNKPPSRQLLSQQSDFEDDERSKNGGFGSFSFRCAFYAAKEMKGDMLKQLEPFIFNEEESALFSRMPRCPMVHLMRADTVFEQGMRSKIILRPDLVVASGIHKVTKHLKGYKTAYIEPEIAILHHYRKFKYNDCNTLDLSMMRFKTLFYDRLKEAVEKFSHILFS